MRIIASDFDGTLNQNGIDDRKRATIAKWRQAGNLFGIISGRGILSLLAVVAQAGVTVDFLLANNGAVLARPDGTMLKDERADGSILQPLLKVLFEQKCSYAFVDGSRLYHVFDDLSQKKNGEFYTPQTLPKLPYFNQVSTRHLDLQRAGEVTELLRQKFGKFVNPLQNGNCIDIVPAGMNKARGIYTLLEQIGADKKDVITVGDQTNDLDMIVEFHSYAMQNAHPAVKQAADAEVFDITDLIHQELKQ